MSACVLVVGVCGGRFSAPAGGELAIEALVLVRLVLRAGCGAGAPGWRAALAATEPALPARPPEAGAGWWRPALASTSRGSGSGRGTPAPASGGRGRSGRGRS